MSEVDALREELARIDREIVRLVGERNRAAEKIGELKAAVGAEVVVPAVEDKVIARYVEAGRGAGVSPAACAKIARTVIDESVDVQGRIPRGCAAQNIFIIGGNGGMGRWLSDFFSRRGHRVAINDVRVEGAGFPVLSLEEGCKADVIILSVPLEAAAGLFGEILRYATKDALIFDILSVKSPLLSALTAAAAAGFQVCSVHPMFGPSAPSPAGRNVIVCGCGCGAADEKAAELFSGATIRWMDVCAHDKIAAYVLSLSHAVSLAFSDALVMSGFTFAEMRGNASTTFRKQVAVSREVAAENAALYYAIQRENPENDAALANLEAAVHRVRTAGRDEFIAAMKNEDGWFAGE